MPKLSVVVPVYNAEKYLNQCIDSVLGQSFTDFELIMVDDGSKDRSGAICDRYAQMDARVVVIHTENRGVVTARRTGVNCAQGEYTAFLDSDDWLDPDFYRDIFEKAGETDPDVLLCARVERATGCVAATAFQPGYYDKAKMESTIFPKMIYDTGAEQYYIVPALWNKVFRTKLLKEIYKEIDPSVTLGEDAVCTYPCIGRANSLFVVDNHACYHYREDHISMVNHCDVHLLQRVCAFAVNMQQQFSAFPEALGEQAQCYVARVSLYAAHQVLLQNRELGFSKRLQAVKDFFADSAIAVSFQAAKRNTCTTRFRLKLNLAMKNRLFLLWLLLRCNSILHGK